MIFTKTDFYIYGLGNPDTQGKFTKNRHNIGKRTIQTFIDQHDLTRHEQREFTYATYQTNTSQPQCQLILSKNWMNLSGVSIEKIYKKTRFDLKHLLIIHDESEMPFGSLRLQFSGGHKGHNGLRDIFLRLGSADFYRLKIGIGRPSEADQSLASHVLANFSEIEEKKLGKLFEDAQEKIDEWLAVTIKRDSD